MISDTGMITDEILMRYRGADLVMIESNHDLQMLNATYPPNFSGEYAQKSGI